MKLLITLSQHDANSLGGDLLTTDLGMVRSEGTNVFSTILVPGIRHSKIDLGEITDNALDSSVYARPFLILLADHGIRPMRVQLQENSPSATSPVMAAVAELLEATAEYVDKKKKKAKKKAKKACKKK